MFNNKKQTAELDEIRKNISDLVAYVKELEKKIEEMYQETHPKTMGGH